MKSRTAGGHGGIRSNGAMRNNLLSDELEKKLIFYLEASLIRIIILILMVKGKSATVILFPYLKLLLVRVMLTDL
ncbi:hypothetical protein [Weissella jogaejeotgali]|uniref:hypothetical protein n=1 Tax=Weissella jogaejeotgali TaxID=1631871 RepID=UPI00094B5882|nr:hypothetical protein [Weissella jogaejeotgali]